LKAVLSHRKLNTNVGDEGGFAPPLPSNRAAVELIVQAIERAGYHSGKEVFLGIDPAASEFYNKGKYHLKKESRRLSSEEMTQYYAELTAEHPVISIEDGLAEDDWDGWRLLTEKIGTRIHLVGDDLFATNPDRLSRGISEHCGNAILIKPNQVGTVSETMDAINRAKKAGWTAIVSHRSGETEDTTIADLAVAMNTGLIKAGAPCRSERVAKYNRLLEIESELGKRGRYAGEDWLAS
jgi:enolase